MVGRRPQQEAHAREKVSGALARLNQRVNGSSGKRRWDVDQEAELEGGDRGKRRLQELHGRDQGLHVEF